MPIFKCPLDRQKSVRLFHVILFIGILLFSIALLVYMYKGFFSRYLADDYCFSSLIKENGFWGGLIQQYVSWSNRFSAYLLTAISELFGQNAIQFLPGLMILFLTISLVWNARIILKVLQFEDSWIVSLFLGEMVTFFILFEAPDLFQSLYWRSGMVSYFAPLVLFAVIQALLLIQFQDKNRLNINKGLLYGLTAILIFFAMGTSETYAALQIGYLLIVGVILGIRIKSLRRIPFLYYLSIFAAFIGSLIILIAPGNQVRLQYLNSTKDLFSVVSLSMTNSLLFIYQSFRGLPVPTLVSFFIAFFLFYHLSAQKNSDISGKQALLLIGSILVCIIFLIACLCSPTAYSMLAYPEQRSLILARMILVIATTLVGAISGVASHRFMDRIIDTCLVSILLIGFLCLYPLRTAYQTWQQIPIVQERAIAWDVRQAEIFKAKNAGMMNIEIKPMNSIDGIYEITADPQFWVNQCAAGYYGVVSIQAVDK